MHERRTPRWRWCGCVGAAVLSFVATGSLVTATVLLPSASASASASGGATSFSALATAEGLRVSTFAGGAPVTNEPAEGGSPIARAVLDSLGTSQAYASVLYPGDALVSLPGLIAGVSGGQLTPPHWPLIATSDRETAPEAEVAGPGATMRASSSASRSLATTTAGTVTATALTETTVDGEVVSSSESVVTGLFSGVIKVGNIRSTAKVVLGPDGTVTRSSAFEVSGLEVAGVKVAVGRDGLVLGENTAPLPSAGDLEKALAEAGIQLRLLAAVETEDAIEGQGLEITLTRETGSAVTPVTIRLRFGRAIASVGRTGGDLVATPLPAPVPAQSGSSAPGFPPDPAPPADSGAPLVPPDTAAIAVPVDGVPFPVEDVGFTPPGPPSVAAGAALPDGSGEAAVALVPRESARAPRTLGMANATVRFDTRNSYLVLAAIAAFLGAVVFLVARFGVKLSWS
jgi:hypothetical protein